MIWKRLTITLLVIFLSGHLAAAPINDWDETAVRKVLHTFAYGGLATDDQIQTWADMSPSLAIIEMLTFSPVNEKLSPSEDASVFHAATFGDIQDFWGNLDATDNPVRLDDRMHFSMLDIHNDFNARNLQRSWIRTVNTRGINPFLHKIVFYLTNYHAAIRVKDGFVNVGLMRDYYDELLNSLVSGDNFTETMLVAATSAAVAMHYGHRDNAYDNLNGVFKGNDDFAREFFQLLFSIDGLNEGLTIEGDNYHEAVSIENNAELLTGMNLDKDPLVYNSISKGDWFVSQNGITKT